jgi:hypothetical protein
MLARWTHDIFAAPRHPRADRRETDMRLMIMHRTNPRWEAGEVPTRELIERVGAMVGELARTGRLLAGEGLRSSALGARLRVQGGRKTVTGGPFPGAAEPPGALAIVDVADLDAAMGWASRLAEGERDIGVDVRPVTEGWHLGVATKPDDVVTERFMLVEHATEEPSARAKRKAPRRAALADMKEAGVLMTGETLAPTAKARRYTFSGGRHSVVDGPFTESKELIGGFVIVRFDSAEEAHDWVLRYADIVGVEEIDLREVEEP